MLLQVILEGIGLGVLLILVCAIGIRKGALHQIAKGVFHKEHAGRAQCCTQERDHDSEKGFQLSHRLCVAVLFVSSIARLVPVFGMLL